MEHEIIILENKVIEVLKTIYDPEIPVDVFENIRGESDSLAGLVLEIAGKFPAQNETVHFENYGFTVVQLDKRRIQKIKLTINPTEIIED